MSALGQKQTCAAQKVMSALPPKADMCGAKRDVRFVPIADIGLGARRQRDAITLGFGARPSTSSQRATHARRLGRLCRSKPPSGASRV